MGKIIKNGVEFSGSVTTGRDLITVKSDTTGDVTVGSGKITLKVTEAQIGTGLTRDNHSVLVGPGIDLVKVSASVFFHAIGATQYGWFDIYKNDTAINITAITNIGTNNYGTATASDILIPVKEGDRISLYNRDGNLQIRCRNTWMTVESVSKQMPATTSSSDSYSYDEIDTGSNWVDGKRIFKKTVDFGSLPNAADKKVAHGITGIQTVMKIEAIMTQGTNSWVIPYNTYVSIVSVEGSNVMIRTTTNYSAYNAYVTLYYTKS